MVRLRRPWVDTAFSLLLSSPIQRRRHPGRYPKTSPAGSIPPFRRFIVHPSRPRNVCRDGPRPTPSSCRGPTASPISTSFPVAASSVFRNGSIGKPMTATADACGLSGGRGSSEARCAGSTFLRLLSPKALSLAYTVRGFLERSAGVRGTDAEEEADYRRLSHDRSSSRRIFRKVSELLGPRTTFTYGAYGSRT